MPLTPEVRHRIIRNAAVSLLIYALPALLLAVTLWITKERPWQQTHTTQPAELVEK